MKLKSIVVLQLLFQDGSTLGWQHPDTATVNLPELSECVTIKSWFMEVDILQFLQNTLEVSSSQLSLTCIRQKCSNYNGFQNIPIFTFSQSFQKFRHTEIQIIRMYVRSAHFQKESDYSCHQNLF